MLEWHARFILMQYDAAMHTHRQADKEKNKYSDGKADKYANKETKQTERKR